MSRIQIPAEFVRKDAHEVWVGWDSPFESFFGQVYDVLENHYDDPDEDERDPIVFWCGTTSHEIKTVSELDKVMSDYCTIPEMIAQQLMDDYNNRTEPTALQRWGREFGNRT
jgi:hypothetical protein